ncbi:MAG: hypothetical protein GYA33_10490 [Thermogutta sp.]|nr:hypothetical protein [Thermogutta sp.]
MSRLKGMLCAAAVCGAIALLGLPVVATAQNTAMQTVGAVAIGGVDRLLEDAEYVGKLADNPQLGEMLKAMIAAQTGGGEGIPGLDAKRPAGILVQTDGMDFYVYGMVPVTNLDDLLKLLSQAGVTAEKQGDVYTVQGPQQTLFAVEKNGWVVLGMNKESLAGVQADPAVLQELAGSYDLAAKVHIQRIPPMFRQLAVALIQQGMQPGMQQAPEQTLEEFELQKRMISQSLAQIQDDLNELDAITVGASLDGSAGSLTLDVQMTVLPDTKMARQLQANTDLTTALAGFVRPNDTLVVQATARYTAESVQSLQQQLEDYKQLIAANLKKEGDLGAKEQKLVTDIMDQLFSQLTATMEKQGADIALSGVLNGETLSIVGGLVLDDPSSLEGYFKELFNEAKKEDPEVGDLVKLDAETYAGVRFHVLQAPNAEIAQDAPEFAEFLKGEDLQVVIGVGEHAIYFAAGSDAVGDLKAALDGSKERKPVESTSHLSVSLKPLMEFIQAVSSDEAGKAQIQALVESMGEGGDVIRAEGKLIPNGTQTRIEIGEGVMKLIAAAVRKGMAGAGRELSPNDL